jgi:hypothetical protein
VRTGATDNAIGCAIMMEAARILQPVGAKPRRTIRVALWSGEEQGLLGSIAYVDQHFGMAENPEAGMGEARCVLEHRRRHGQSSWRIDLRPAGGRHRPRPVPQTVREMGRVSARHDTEPRDGRHRQHLVQSGRPAGHGRLAGHDRVRQHDASHESRHVRTHRAGRRDEERGDFGVGGLFDRQSRQDDAAPRTRPDAAASGRRGRRRPRRRSGRGADGGPAHVCGAEEQGADDSGARLLPATPQAAPAGTAPTAAIDAQPQHGKVALKADGSFVYTPNKDYAGTDTFTYKVTRGGATSTPGTVTITVK